MHGIYMTGFLSLYAVDASPVMAVTVGDVWFINQPGPYQKGERMMEELPDKEAYRSVKGIEETARAALFRAALAEGMDFTDQRVRKSFRDRLMRIYDAIDERTESDEKWIRRDAFVQLYTSGHLPVVSVRFMGKRYNSLPKGRGSRTRSLADLPDGGLKAAAETIEREAKRALHILAGMEGPRAESAQR